MGVVIGIIDSARTSILDELESNISYIGTGSDDTTPAESDTTLGAETIREAVFSTEKGANYFSATMFQDTSDNNGNNIKEIAVFNQASGGTMYNRKLTNVIAKSSSVEMFAEVRFNLEIETL